MDSLAGFTNDMADADLDGALRLRSEFLSTHHDLISQPTATGSVSTKSNRTTGR
jgi:hypothetical protein